MKTKTLAAAMLLSSMMLAMAQGGNPTDSDNDGLSDQMEATLGTDPQNPDSDNDGLKDGFEHDYGLEPLDQDCDGDSINVNRAACKFADAIIIGSETVDTTVDYLSVSQDKPVLPLQPEADFLPTYLEFYHSLETEEVAG